MEIFNLIRENIRTYQGIEGHVLETFSREDFLEKTTLSIYVPHRYAGYDNLIPSQYHIFCFAFYHLIYGLQIYYWTQLLPTRYGHRRLFRGLFHDYPGLIAKYRCRHGITLEATPARPNRAGDSILIISGDILKKFALLPENFIFHVNAHWKITIKGGDRTVDPLTEVEDLARDAELSFSKAKDFLGE